MLLLLIRQLREPTLFSIRAVRALGALELQGIWSPYGLAHQRRHPSLWRGTRIVALAARRSPPLATAAQTQSCGPWAAKAPIAYKHSMERVGVLFSGGGVDEQMTFVRRFQTPIAVNGRIFVAADSELYAFRTQ